MNKKQASAVLVLLILYAVGAIGSITGRWQVMHLTPINLLISTVILFAFHPVNERALLVYALVVFVCGYLIEWVGVETGRIFGSYFYGNNLGIKLFDVPLIIGINWLLLSYCSSVIISNIIGNKNVVLLSAIGALLMVLVDFFIEQRAPDFDFWYWQNNVVPLQNYTAWFAFAFAFNFLFFKLHINNKNPIAPVLYLLQLLFFVALFFLL